MTTLSFVYDMTELDHLQARTERAYDAARDLAEPEELAGVFWRSFDHSERDNVAMSANVMRKLAHNRRDSQEYRKAIAYAYAAIMLQRLAAELGNQ